MISLVKAIPVYHCIPAILNNFRIFLLYKHFATIKYLCQFYYMDANIQSLTSNIH